MYSLETNSTYFCMRRLSILIFCYLGRVVEPREMILDCIISVYIYSSVYTHKYRYIHTHILFLLITVDVHKGNVSLKEDTYIVGNIKLSASQSRSYLIEIDEQFTHC